MTTPSPTNPGPRHEDQPGRRGGHRLLHVPGHPPGGVARTVSWPARVLPALIASLLLGGIADAHADRPGPSSRRTSWVFSEIHAHPAPRADGKVTAFVEIQNTGLIAEDLVGHRLSGRFDFVFPAGSVVPPSGYLVVAPTPGDVEREYGISGVLGGFPVRESAGGTLRLSNPAGAVLLETSWANHAPWPAAAAGLGASMVLSRPSFGEADPRAWSASLLVGGSPGVAEPTASPPRGIVINEILCRSADEGLGFVEVLNLSSEAVDLSGCRFATTDGPLAMEAIQGLRLEPGERRAIPFPATVPAASVAEGVLGLISPDGWRWLDAVHFGPQEPGVSQGRSPEGAPELRPLRIPTPGTTNAAPLERPIVFTEIHYHPLPDDRRLEFVELFNRGDHAVDLSGWRFVDGVAFEFPAGARLGPGAYAVVAADRQRLLAAHPRLAPDRVWGDFAGSLADGGERLALAMPVEARETEITGLTRIVRRWVVVEEVTYDDGGAWGRWSDGGGSSLELRDPRADRGLAPNWADSDESSKARWTQVEHTELLSLGSGSPNQLQLLAMGPGAWLIDDVQVLRNGANRVANPTFNSGTNGWICRGTQAGSTWAPTLGMSGSGALRIDAVARGDTGANRIETAVSPALSPGDTATLKASLRWIAGHPEYLLRLRGGYSEAVGRLDVPSDLGSPGTTNSRAVANAGPALQSLEHTPTLPGAGQPVTVTVRVHDPDGIRAVVLQYRLDPATSVLEIPMLDDGQGADRRADDGVYSATLPAQAAGRLIAFRVRAVDDARPPLEPAESWLPTREEALVRWGETEPAGSLGTYRIWTTQATFSRWSTRPKLDNSPLPVTFVYNAERVIHGVGALFAGSPHLSPSYTTPSGNLCGYTLVFPSDEPFLGAKEIVLDWPGRDSTAQQEPVAYWIARELRVPFNHRRYVRLHVNGVTETARGSIYEDAQQVNSDSLESWNPSSAGENGDLFKIEQWFEFDDRLGTTQAVPPRLENYLAPDGTRKIARYRWNWLRRAAGQRPDDFSSLFTLVDAATHADPGLFRRRMGGLADIDEWMRIFATENIVVNLDAWGYDIGKNMYAYRPVGGRWQLHMWDIDWVMLASAQHGYSPTSPLMYRGPAVFGEANRDPAVARLYREPIFQRMYWQAIQDAVDGPLLPARVAERLDATYQALVAHGVTRSSGSALTGPAAVKTWLLQRRSFLLQQLASVSATFSLDPIPSSVSDTRTLLVSGTAPIQLAEIRANQRKVHLEWSSVTRWTASIPLEAGRQFFRLEGFDRLGNRLAEAEASFEVQVGALPPVPAGLITINEWQAANASTVTDPSDGGYDDWFELFNADASPADLTGYFLSDDPANPTKFVIPPATVVPPRGFLLVWADEATRTGDSPDGALHANFKLSQSGESLLLSRYDGTLVDRFDFGPQPRDASSGRWPDGATDGTVGRLVRPTPGSPNAVPLDSAFETRIHSVRRLDDGTLLLQWSAGSVATYRIETSPTLVPARWTGLGSPVVNQTPSVVQVTTLPNASTGFYRVARVGP